VALGASPLTRRTLLMPLPAVRHTDLSDDSSDATPCALDLTVDLAVRALHTRAHTRTRPHATASTALRIAGLYVHVVGAVLCAGALSSVTVGSAVEPEHSQEHTHIVAASASSATTELEVQSRAAAVASAATRLAEGLATASTSSSGAASELADVLGHWCGGWDAWPEAVVASPLGVAALAYWCGNPNSNPFLRGDLP